MWMTHDDHLRAACWTMTKEITPPHKTYGFDPSCMQAAELCLCACHGWGCTGRCSAKHKAANAFVPPAAAGLAGHAQQSGTERQPCSDRIGNCDLPCAFQSLLWNSSAVCFKVFRLRWSVVASLLAKGLLLSEAVPPAVRFLKVLACKP